MNVSVNATPAPDRTHFGARFLEGLNRRADELTAYSSALQQTEQLDAAMRLFHSIAELGGTFGFHLVTRISRRAETLCARALESGVKLSVEDRLVVLQTIVQLRAAAANSS